MSDTSWKIEADFKHAGYRCVVMITSIGHRCGYVGIPKDHPLYRCGYFSEHPALKSSNIETQDKGKRGIVPLAIRTSLEICTPDVYFDVHGSITYSDSQPNYPVPHDKLWWFGYDCNHYGDVPDIAAIADQSIRRHSLNRQGIVRTRDYCINECISLARQLRAVHGKPHKEDGDIISRYNNSLYPFISKYHKEV